MKIIQFAFITALCLIQAAELATPKGKSFQNSSRYNRFIEAKDVDWCALNCEKEEHIACRLGGKCSTADPPCKFMKVNAEKLLEDHNKLRNEFASGKNSIAPNVQAANMMALSWDNDLAFLAQCNLVKCPAKMTHDHCHGTETIKYGGQNLAWSRGLEDCIAFTYTSVQAWYDEYKLLTEAEINSTTKDFKHFDKKVGHFTQLVWAESKFLGCALTIKGKSPECMLACNYGPAGNFLGKGMYIPGPPASQCPDGVKPNSKFTGLCGETEIPPPPSSSMNHKIDSILFLIFSIQILNMWNNRY